MTNLCPLYDTLHLQIKQNPNKTAIDILKLCSTINNIPTSLPKRESFDHLSKIGALIIHHNMIHNEILSSHPYNGKVMVGNLGILYFMNEFPPLLQQIIAQYVENSSNISSISSNIDVVRLSKHQSEITKTRVQEIKLLINKRSV